MFSINGMTKPAPIDYVVTFSSLPALLPSVPPPEAYGDATEAPRRRPVNLFATIENHSSDILDLRNIGGTQIKEIIMEGIPDGP